MKKTLLILLLITSLIGFGQSMNIKWEDDKGREFSINSKTGSFEYSMISGDQIEYITISKSYLGPVGSVHKVGDVEIEYITSSKSYLGPVGSVLQVGGLEIEYITSSKSYLGPVGSIKSTSGSVR